MISLIEEAGLQPKYIINTHGHIDHIAFNKKFKDLYGADILIHENDAPWLGEQQDSELFAYVGASESPPADRLLRDGEEITVGNIRLEVIHTPGHTPGGISLRHDDFTLTGDTLFAEGVGRTDLPGGSYEQMIESIRTKLLTLPEETVIYPGHGEKSTIGDEIENNPFLQL